jgi:hypothetical protein
MGLVSAWREIVVHPTVTAPVTYARTRFASEKTDQKRIILLGRGSFIYANHFFRNTTITTKFLNIELC